MARPKQEKTEELGVMFQMGQIVAKIEERLSKLEYEVEKLREKKEEPKSKPVLPDQNYPIPLEYKEIVNTVLNAKFGIDIAPSKDKPEFLFTIIVPKEYSNMTEEDWKLKGADLRSKVVSYAEGINGVRSWCELVFKNLGAEIEEMVVSDRTKLVGER